MFNKLSSYINNNRFKITVYNDKIHILNYQKIISLENEFISLLGDNKKIIIKGINLKPKKIFDNEILIIGTVNNIEVIND